MEKKIMTSVQKGIVITLVLIVFGLIIYFTGQMENKALSLIQYVILIGGIIWSCTSYASQMDGNVTFGNVFAHGFKTTAAVTALIAIYSFIAFKFLFPDIIDISIAAAKKEMELNKSMSEEQKNQALEITRSFFVPFAIAFIIVAFAIIGAISSLIGAAVAKKKPKDPFAQPQM